MSIITRRGLVAGAAFAAATPALLRPTVARADAKVLKISHQFPASSGDTGDFRDRLVRRFAAEVEARTKGEVRFEIYPGSSLMKTVAQFSAVRRGALDLSLYPLAYAGGEIPEVNIGLMPSLVASYAQGMAWKQAEIGKQLTDLLDKRGVKILTWVWQGGGVASRAGAVVVPDDTKGLKIRGGSREMDLMLKAAGGIISSVPSDEIYAAMQTGSLDAAVTSTTSLISFRLQESARNVTNGRAGSFWFMLEPLLMSKSVFDGLSATAQQAITEVGAAQESWALAQAKADDDSLTAIFTKANVKAQAFSADALAKWKAVAEKTAWPDYAGRNANCAALLKIAESVKA